MLPAADNCPQTMFEGWMRQGIPNEVWRRLIKMTVVKKPVYPCDFALTEQERWEDGLYGWDSIVLFFLCLDFRFLFCPIVEKLHMDGSDIYALYFLHDMEYFNFYMHACVTVLEFWHQGMYVQMGGKDSWRLSQEL